MAGKMWLTAQFGDCFFRLVARAVPAASALPQDAESVIMTLRAGDRLVGDGHGNP